jgi:hypothetical protein
MSELTDAQLAVAAFVLASEGKISASTAMVLAKRACPWLFAQDVVDNWRAPTYSFDVREG